MIKRDLNAYFSGGLDESTIRRLRSEIDYLRLRKQILEERREAGMECYDAVNDEIVTDWEIVINDLYRKLFKAEQEYKEVLIRLKKSQINKEFEDY